MEENSSQDSSTDIRRTPLTAGSSSNTVNSIGQDQVDSEYTEIISLTSEGTVNDSVIQENGTKKTEICDLHVNKMSSEGMTDNSWVTVEKIKIDVSTTEEVDNSGNTQSGVVAVPLPPSGLQALTTILKYEHLTKSSLRQRRAQYSQDKKIALSRSMSMGTDIVDQGTNSRKFMRHASLIDYENILERYKSLEKKHESSSQEIKLAGNNVETTFTVNSSPSQADKTSLARKRWRHYMSIVRMRPGESSIANTVAGSNEELPTLKPSTPKSRRRFMMSNYITDRLLMKGTPAELKNDRLTCIVPETTSTTLQGAAKIWIGKDYCNFIFRDFVDLEAPFEDMIDRTQTPRMPWHDIGTVVYGHAAQDVARHFIQRWNVTKIKKMRNDDHYPFLFPKIRLSTSNPHASGKMNIQILRSVSQWSAGNQYCENSIQNAYVACIENAKHFIYIENQFFISKVTPDRVVSNKINQALFHRILKAHKAMETFRVYIVMPLLPAFEGELGTNKGTVMQTITHWNYTSFCRGDNSLLVRLKQEGILDPFDYVTFYGLRNHGELLGKLTTELIYVHSKMMIVDDDTSIIGSANINDRSMHGEHDSEIAVMVQDLETFPVKFNGKPHKAGYFSSTLRQTLFKEHLGVQEEDSMIDVSDPVRDSFYKQIWIQQANNNTKIYEEVFHCFPNDQILTFEDLKEYNKQASMAETQPEQARGMVQGIHGHLVLIPLNFLSKEILTPPVVSKEAFLPTETWT